MTLAVAKSCGPGRPKDLEKRAAILPPPNACSHSRASKARAWTRSRAEAGVSKLTVYSHFTDKETLFVAAIRARCTDQVPDALFNVDTSGPVRGTARSDRSRVPRADHEPRSDLAASPAHGEQRDVPKLAQLFWEAGPLRMRQSFEQFLAQEVDAGKLDIPNIPRAASQFFALLKGELHARLLCGCTESLTAEDIGEHVDATVELCMRCVDAARRELLIAVAALS